MKKSILILSVLAFGFLTSCQKTEELPVAAKEISASETVYDQDNDDKWGKKYVRNYSKFSTKTPSAVRRAISNRIIRGQFNTSSVTRTLVVNSSGTGGIYYKKVGNRTLPQKFSIEMVSRTIYNKNNKQQSKKVTRIKFRIEGATHYFSYSRMVGSGTLYLMKYTGSLNIQKRFSM